MVFWQNNRYEFLENKAQGGDALRGLPALRFPWKMHTHTYTDEQGDRWTGVAHCLEITPADHSPKVHARLVFDFTCQISEKNIEHMGLSSRRLEELDVKEDLQLHEKVSTTLTLPLDQLEAQMHSLFKKLSQSISAKYTATKKQEVTQRNIGTLRLSRFF
jgi:hypothetical protein